MGTVHIDAHLDRPCAQCGAKTSTFSIPGSDKGLCSDCIVKNVKSSKRGRRDG